MKTLTKAPNAPTFSTYYRVIKTKDVAEWVSATSPIGTFELKLLDGSVLTFERSEIEPITPEQYMRAQKKIFKFRHYDN